MRNLAFIVATTAATATYADCPVKVGATVGFTPATDLATLFESVPNERGPFETTEEFEQRQQVFASSLSADYLVIETVRDEEQYRYEADDEAYYFETWFFGNISYGFENDALSEAGLIQAGFIEEGTNSYGSVPVLADEAITGEYTGTTALGASVPITATTFTRFHVAEVFTTSEIIPFGLGPIFAADSEALMEDALGEDEMTNVVKLPMSRSKAPEMMGRFRPAVVFSPRAPYIATSTRHIAPEVSRPYDNTVNTTVFIADVQCGLITDDLGQVLKVVEVVGALQ